MKWFLAKGFMMVSPRIHEGRGLPMQYRGGN